MGTDPPLVVTGLSGHILRICASLSLAVAHTRQVLASCIVGDELLHFDEATWMKLTLFASVDWDGDKCTAFSTLLS